MKLFTQEVEAILLKYEVIASNRAVYEDGELSYYKDEIDDDLDECYKEFLTLAESVVPALKLGKIKYEDLALGLRAKSIYEFADYIRSENENFPMLDGYVETLQDWLWAPLHESLRKVFTLEVVRDISTQSEFDLVWLGYCEALELYSIYVYNIEEVSKAASVIAHLQSLNRANPAQSEQMSLILDKLQGIIDNFVPPRSGGFTQRSAGLEDEISMWIHEVTTNPQVISLDEIMESNFVDENPNIEPLKAGWLKLDGEIVKVTGNRFWELLDSNIETGFRTDRKFLGKKKNKTFIHTLYQLQEIVSGESDESYNRPLDKWKICLLRTGSRDEYLPNEGNGLLAAQLLIASKVLETSIDNFSAEVLWLRLGQRDSVLEGISRVEAEALAKAHFENS
jgi:hypothetical protein